MSKAPKLRFKEFSGDWESKKLGNICEVTMGQSPSSSCYNEENIGLPLIQGNADVKDRKTAPRIYTSDITKTCDVGDIIMSVRAPVGAISKSIHNACIGRGVCSIKPKQNNEFIYQILLKYEDKWGRISQGSTFESVNRTDITETKVTIPSIEEQEKIASFFSLIDDKISLQGEKVEALKDYKRGMMQKIFSRELRFKDDEGRDYPEWEEKKFKDFTKINQGLQIPISERYTTEGENRYFYITNEFLKSDSETKYYIENPSESVICYEDDILMTRTGNTGKVVTGVKGAFHNNFFKIAYDKEKYDRMFLYYILTSHKMQKNIIRLAGSSTIPDLNHSDFYNIKVKLPIIEEQKKIADLLIRLDSKISKEQEKLDSLNEYKKGLLQQMFV